MRSFLHPQLTKKDRQRPNLCTKRDLTGLLFASRVRDNDIKKRAIPVSQNPLKLISLGDVSSHRREVLAAI